MGTSCAPHAVVHEPAREQLPCAPAPAGPTSPRRPSVGPATGGRAMESSAWALTESGKMSTTWTNLAEPAESSGRMSGGIVNPVLLATRTAMISVPRRRKALTRAGRRQHAGADGSPIGWLIVTHRREARMAHAVPGHGGPARVVGSFEGGGGGVVAPGGGGGKNGPPPPPPAIRTSQ